MQKKMLCIENKAYFFERLHPSHLVKDLIPSCTKPKYKTTIDTLFIVIKLRQICLKNQRVFKRIEFILTKVVIDTSTLATNEMDSQRIREIDRFSPILDHSYLFQDFCVGEMWRPFDASIGGSRVCVFSLSRSDDTVSKLFCLLLLCSSPPRKEIFPGYFWSVVVDVFFVFCLKVSLMKFHVLNPWS